ncbi:MAG: Imm30 family immunity protein [Hormoscilla sp.]
MRCAFEIAAFENALTELAQNPQNRWLPELHLVLDDRCQQQDVMWDLIHFLESFDMKAQLLAFVKVLPELMARAPEWTEILHYRICNDESARVLYEEILLYQDLEVGNIVESLKADISDNTNAIA